MLRGRAYEQLKQQYDLDRKDYAVQLVSQMEIVVGQAISDRQYGAAVGAAVQLMKITGIARKWQQQQLLRKLSGTPLSSLTKILVVGLPTMLSIPRFQTSVYIFIFLGMTYFCYQILDNSTATQGTSQDEQPTTSKPWPWESRFKANQNQPDNIPLKTPDNSITTIAFDHAFPDFYSIFKEKPVDELGQNWDDSLGDTFAKYAPPPPDLQIDETPGLGQIWDN